MQLLSNDTTDVVRRHTDYGITNGEWMLNGGDYNLYDYLVLRLNIRHHDFVKYSGILNYYVRNEYGLDYSSCRSGTSLLQGRMLLDPWNRRFVVFPYEPRRFVGLHGYERYYSDVVFRVRGSRTGDGYNVILMTTTVNGNRVYCVDILEGEYV